MHVPHTYETEIGKVTFTCDLGGSRALLRGGDLDRMVSKGCLFNNLSPGGSLLICLNLTFASSNYSITRFPWRLAVNSITGTRVCIA